ncbi:uncharacterized protein A4U43_C05F23600 [Asparagus officinalis]|uniref:Uncharacterized protein n=1 Tax=Asparagus officinalis TaxID=4686 RepID=A0A5P1EYD2_ASPOF|nr:uncharacterized protein A4U43_C05F23600 [Asparagus officinalis]
MNRPPPDDSSARAPFSSRPGCAVQARSDAAKPQQRAAGRLSRSPCPSTEPATSSACGSYPTEHRPAAHPFRPPLSLSSPSSGPRTTPRRHREHRANRPAVPLARRLLSLHRHLNTARVPTPDGRPGALAHPRQPPHPTAAARL